MNIEMLQKILLECYTKELCYPQIAKNWTPENKCFGMCAITTLIVNDYFKGEIAKIYVGETSHYFNIINDKIIDLSSSQFIEKIDYSNYKIIKRENLKEETIKRYKILKERVSSKLLSQIDKKVNQCKLCKNLVEKFPNDKTVYLGRDNDIVLVGEAPANNGWRKSHKVWHDVNGKILPSAIILQKLFDLIDKDVLETTFLESVKCYPLERKNLKICSEHCKNIMLEQLKIINPKLIITLGEFPTRNLLNFKFKKFCEVVGNIYEGNGYKILPIYHPSPISPKSYKGNIPIFEKIAQNNKSL